MLKRIPCWYDDDMHGTNGTAPEGEGGVGWGLWDGRGVICEKWDVCCKDVGIANGSESLLTNDASKYIVLLTLI